jgi:hypothetical protein
MDAWIMAIVDLVPIPTHLVHGIAKSAAVRRWATRRQKLTSVPALAVGGPGWGHAVDPEGPAARQVGGSRVIRAQNDPRLVGLRRLLRPQIQIDVIFVHHGDPGVHK